MWRWRRGEENEEEDVPDPQPLPRKKGYGDACKQTPSSVEQIVRKGSGKRSSTIKIEATNKERPKRMSDIEDDVSR